MGARWDMERAVGAARACMSEMIPELLCAPGCEALGEGEELPRACRGLFLTLRDGEVDLDVFLYADAAGMVTLTRAMLQFEEDDEDPSDEDVRDAVGEIVNVLGGLIKEELSEPGDPSTMGLPFPAPPGLELPTGSEVRALRFQVVGVEVTVALALRGAEGGDACSPRDPTRRLPELERRAS